MGPVCYHPVMLTLHSAASRDCSGLARRDFIRAGVLGLGSLSLAHLLAAKAVGRAAGKSYVRDRSIVLLFLGGGGWFGVETLYRPFGPARDRLMARLSIGIAAGASLVFDIGVASGGVYFLVYLNVEYTYSHGNNDLRITLGIVIHGEVRVLSIITVSLTLMFEASYESGGRMTCRGMLRLKIKICWCFSITVKKSVTIVLAGKSAEGQDSRFTLPGTGRRADGGMAAIPKLRPTASESVRAAVRDYIHSFGD